IVIDLVEDFISLCLQQNDTPVYEARYPSFFEHYYRFWCSRDRPRVDSDARELRLRAARVRRAIDLCASRLRRWDLSPQGLTVILFVGRNTSNGHAFLNGDKWVVWIPVETYSTDLLAKVFVTHEVVHALHYRGSPGFYFNDKQEKERLSRQLITEGVATFLTTVILDCSDQEALWGDFLTQHQYDTWPIECRKRALEFAKSCYEHFSESSYDSSFFRILDPKKIVADRCAYLLGLDIVRDVSRKENIAPLELLKLGREDFECRVLRELESQS
ncbi:MAG: hypothetical protein AB1772_11665, partial [Candidatus Zixiibacteriota bacterium]